MQNGKNYSLFNKLERAERAKAYLKEVEEAQKAIQGLGFILNMKNWVLVNNNPDNYDWLEGRK